MEFKAGVFLLQEKSNKAISIKRKKKGLFIVHKLSDRQDLGKVKDGQETLLSLKYPQGEVNMDQRILKHLNEDYNFPVRDPLWKHIYVSQGLKRILVSKDFLRLGRIRQLGPAGLIYPGATHTRLNHSLGVFYLSYKLIQRLIQQQGCPSLTLEGVKAFLAAALLHDLGHFPHAHSLKELPLKDHENLSAEILLQGDIARIIKEEVGSDPEFSANIIDKSRKIPEEHRKELIFYRNLLSGVLDPDKLDYLTRDAYFCGVAYGIQDTDFVLSQVLPIETGLAIPNKGITAIENVLFSKYLMYKTVYWHKGVRIATALVKKALFLALKSGELTAENLYGMDDDSFFQTMRSLNPELKQMMEDSETPYSYQILGSWDYDSSEGKHPLMDLEKRLEKEKEIHQQLCKRGYKLNSHQVLIDITGKISFEVDLPVMHHGRLTAFPDTDTVFTRDVVHDFTGKLQKIRVIIPHQVRQQMIDQSKIEEILQVIHF